MALYRADTDRAEYDADPEPSTADPDACPECAGSGKTYRGCIDGQPRWTWCLVCGGTGSGALAAARMAEEQRRMQIYNHPRPILLPQDWRPGPESESEPF